MSQALRIFTHAISMVFRDLGATLRATSVGVTLVAVAVVMLIVAAPDMLGGLMALDTGNADGMIDIPNIGLVLPAFLLMTVGYLMMVAAWHRYVLLPNERRDEGFTPSAGIVLGYFGRSLLLGIAIGLLAIPVFIPVGIIAAATGSDTVAAIAAIPLFALLGWMLLRLSLILPACTIGHQLTFSASWQATKPLAGTIFGIMILFAVLDFALNFALELVITQNLVSGLISVIVSVFYALVSASILTTLYGIAIEGREV